MTEMDISSSVELYDSDFLAMESGPLRWARAAAGSVRNIDRFVNDLIEQFAEIKLGVQVQVWDTNQDGLYAFKIEIIRRIEAGAYDYDRQVHEVVSNILDLPGQEGWIKTSEALAHHNREIWTPSSHKGHRHGNHSHSH